jgi:hypothetical protein
MNYKTKGSGFPVVVCHLEYKDKISASGVPQQSRIISQIAMVKPK